MQFIQARRGNDGEPVVNLEDFPNANFFYKMVAKVDGKYFSIYDASVEYELGKALH